MLTIPLDQLAFIVEKAREFAVEVEPLDKDPGSNPTDDGGVAILESNPDNPAEEQLTTAIDSLDRRERAELLALLFLGRGDFDKSEWRAALTQAYDIRDEHETHYLVGTPLLADYLEEGAAQLGISLDRAAERRL
jgi:hypothetical protein